MSQRIREVMTANPSMIEPSKSVVERRLMAQHQVRRLPVVGEDGRFVGVLAQADVAREGDDTQTGQVVQEISE